MARPSKIPDDPKILDEIIENMAYGLSSRLIAESLGINENTVKGWKLRKDFNQKLAIKKLQILREPLKATAERFPKDFIERHPDLRETFAPPKQVVSQDLSITGKKALDLSDDELASMIPDKPKKVQEASEVAVEGQEQAGDNVIEFPKSEAK